MVWTPVKCLVGTLRKQLRRIKIHLPHLRHGFAKKQKNDDAVRCHSCCCNFLKFFFFEDAIFGQHPVTNSLQQLQENKDFCVGWFLVHLTYFDWFFFSKTSESCLIINPSVGAIIDLAEHICEGVVQ